MTMFGADVGDIDELQSSFVGAVFESPERPRTDAATRAAALGVATVAASIGRPAGYDRVLEASALHRIAGAGCVAGWAVTVWNPSGHNTMLRYGIELCRPGDVLVVSTPTDGAAQWGDLAHEWAVAKGVAGVVVDGSVRDVAAVRGLGTSLWARSVDPRQAGREALGYVNAPVRVAGTPIRPGDLVIADDDAIMVLAPEDADDVLAGARRRADHEDVVRENTRRGQPWPDRTDDSSRRVKKLPHPWNAVPVIHAPATHNNEAKP